MDTEPVVAQELKLGDIATGSINPASRELSGETLGNVERDVRTGRFDVPVIEGYFLPCGCIDGRCPHDGEAFNPVPNAAGGTLSLLVAELLTNESNLAASAVSSEEALASLITYLETLSYNDQAGGHTGPSHGSETASGCGANDQLEAILGKIVKNQDEILGVLALFGVPVDKEGAYPAMVAKADQLLRREGYFSTGKVVAGTLKEASPNGNCPELTGAHNEVTIRLNTVEGTTLDRRALKQEYGDDYQVFNVDIWALRKAADTLSETEEEADAKFTAMVAYQVATALQLCGPSMKVIVR